MSRFHGILVIDKPAGWTSHDVVGWTRRWLGQKRVGHAGTLDPAATGVLPIVVGDATRFVEYLADTTKSYLAEITFGIETDSADVDGVVTEDRRPVHVSLTALEAVLPAFRGEIEQRPPMHSAIKIGGKRLYELARRGETIDVPTRSVNVLQLDVVDVVDDVATLVVSCSKGTYIRSLGRDIGAALGVGAYLSNLVRRRTGPFSLCDAWSVQELAEHPAELVWPLVAERSDAALGAMRALVLRVDQTDDWHAGRLVAVDGIDAPGPVRVYGPDGGFAGIGEATDDLHAYHPAKVLHEAA